MTDQLDLLDTREREILSLILSGLAHREIADALDLQHQTIRNRASQMYKDLGVPNRTGLMLWAMNNGLTPDTIAPWLNEATKGGGE